MKSAFHNCENTNNQGVNANNQGVNANKQGKIETSQNTAVKYSWFIIAHNVEIKRWYVVFDDDEFLIVVYHLT